MNKPIRILAILLMGFAALLFLGCDDEFPMGAIDFQANTPRVLGAARAVAFDAAGNRYVASIINSETQRLIDINPVEGRAAGILKPGANLLITRLNANGSFAWGQIFGGRRVHPFGTLDARAMLLANGRVYVAGDIGNPSGFSNTRREYTARNGSTDAFVIALDMSSGDPVLGFGSDGAVLFGERGQESVRALAITPEGSTLFLGGTSGSPAGETVFLPGGASYTATGAFGFVLALDAFSGVARTPGLKTFDGPVEALAIRNSRVYVLGDFDTDIDVFGKPLSDATLIVLDNVSLELDRNFNGGAVFFGSRTASATGGSAFGRSLALSSDGQTIFAAGGFQGENFGFNYRPDFTSADDGIDFDNYDTFIYAVDATTGAPHAGFGRDATGDGEGDGIAILDRRDQNLCQQILVQGDARTGSLFVLANSPVVVRNTAFLDEPDIQIAKLSAATGSLDLGFSEDGIQTYGGRKEDTAASFLIRGDRLYVAGYSASQRTGFGSDDNDFNSENSDGVVPVLSTIDGEGLDVGPRIFTIDPTRANSPSLALTLTVAGRGFTSTDVVLWNDEELPTEFVDDRTLKTTVSSGHFADPGRNADVVVLNPRSRKSSNSVIFSIVGRGSPPVLTRIESVRVERDVRSYELTILGSGFEDAATARVEGVPCETEVVSETKIRATFDSLQIQDGSYSMTASNPGSGASNTILFFPGMPRLDSISPNSRPAGSPAVTIDIQGAGFSPDAVAYIDGLTASGGGKLLATTYINSSLLRAEIRASDMVRVDQAEIYVRNLQTNYPSYKVPFTVTTSVGQPFIFGLIPSSVLESPGFTLDVLAGGFVEGAEILWNGSPRPTSFLVAPPRLRTRLTAADLQEASASGVASVAVRASGQTSDAVQFVVGPPSVSQISPPSVLAGGNDFMLSVTGSRFAIDAEVLWNGAPRATTYLSPTQLVASIPSEDIAQPGIVDVRVMNRFVTDSDPITFNIGGAPGLRAGARGPQVLRVRDGDRDGYADDLERLLGSSPENAASTPHGFLFPPKISWLAWLAPQLKSVCTGRGRLIISGRLPLPAGFEPAGKRVHVYADGRLRSFVLDARGASPRGHETFHITVPRRTAQATAKGAAFVLRIKRANPYGPVLLHIGETLYQLPEPLPRQHRFPKAGERTAVRMIGPAATANRSRVIANP